MQARVDYHLDDKRLFNFVDSVSWPNTKAPLANVEYPQRDLGVDRTSAYSTYCDFGYGNPNAYEGTATQYLLANNTAFTNRQEARRACTLALLQRPAAAAQPTCSRYACHTDPALITRRCLTSVHAGALHLRRQCKEHHARVQAAALQHKRQGEALPLRLLVQTHC